MCVCSSCRSASHTSMRSSPCMSLASALLQFRCPVQSSFAITQNHQLISSPCWKKVSGIRLRCYKWLPFPASSVRRRGHKYLEPICRRIIQKFLVKMGGAGCLRGLDHPWPQLHYHACPYLYSNGQCVYESCLNLCVTLPIRSQTPQPSVSRYTD